MQSYLEVPQAAPPDDAGERGLQHVGLRQEEGHGGGHGAAGGRGDALQKLVVVGLWGADKKVREGSA